MSRKLINTLNTHCATDTRTYKFTGKSWAKKVIKGILEIYVEEWWWFYELYFVKGDKTSIPKEISLEKKYCTMINLYCEKARNLPMDKQQWFKQPLEHFLKMNVTQLKNWTKQKRIFKANRIYRTNNRKITNYSHPQDLCSSMSINSSVSYDLENNSTHDNCQMSEDTLYTHHKNYERFSSKKKLNK